MPLFLDTRGRGTLGIGICARCSQKFSLEELMPDPNAPGLRVCRDDLDELDPWRLPAPPPDRITLRYPRPDSQLFPFGSTPVYPVPIEGVSQVLPTRPWQPGTYYPVGASVTPLNADSPAVNGPQYEYVATVPGHSGSGEPSWPNRAGTTIDDGDVTWFCLGIFLLDGQTQSQQLLPDTPEIPPPMVVIIVPPPLPYAGILINDGGMVGVDDPVGWVDVAGAPGSYYLNSGAVMIVPGGVATSTAPIFFQYLSAAALLRIPGANFQKTPGPDGSGIVWNNSGFLWVS